jgi:hypothetical protein
MELVCKLLLEPTSPTISTQMPKTLIISANNRNHYNFSDFGGNRPITIGE